MGYYINKGDMIGSISSPLKDAERFIKALFSFFFISVGLQIDLVFLQENLWSILLVLLAVYLTNHLLNTIVLRIFSCSWREALLGGALLAQIGELSFLLSSTALSLGIIGDFSYKFTICLIILILIIIPFWIGLTEKIKV
jgi:CPA2 family monovalent cation:H+ antiporter-2